MPGDIFSRVDQILPNKSRITRISTTSPTPPLGAYPHDRLCGQMGMIPTSANIKIMSKMVPSVMSRSPYEIKINVQFKVASNSAGLFNDEVVFNRFDTLHGLRYFCSLGRGLRGIHEAAQLNDSLERFD